MIIKKVTKKMLKQEVEEKKINEAVMHLLATPFSVIRSFVRVA